MNWWGAKRNGFTIVELLIVIIVIGILATITIVAYNGIQRSASESVAKNNVSQALKKIDIYRQATGGGSIYPNSIAVAEIGSSNTDALSYFYDADNNAFCVQSKSGTTSYSATNKEPNPQLGDCGRRDLLGWWPLNNSTSDILGINTSTNNGAVSTIGQNGLADRAYSFVYANNTWIGVNNTPALTSDIQTFSFWLYPTSWTNGHAALFAKRNLAANGLLIFHSTSSSTIQYDCGGSSQRWDTGYSPPTATWTHIVITCSALGNQTLFVNGVLTNSNSGVNRAALLTATTGLRFGRDTTSSNLNYDGSLDDIRLYSRVLSAPEALQLYSAGAE